MAEREISPAGRCPRCGAELPAGVPPDLCPKCLLQAALPTQAGSPATEKVPGAPVPARSRGLPQPGEQLGHYRILRLLGEGGMGAVFDAEDLESGRRVALKVLSQTLDSPQARERFFREGRLAASINHPNSVYVFGTEEIGGTPVITMELVAGGTLQEHVLRQGPLPVGEAVDCTLQIIAGLEAAQRIGILHRDIKPSNCFLDPDGAVKIGDFGLSIATEVRTEPALTATGAFLGTPAFCSPEQLRGDELNVRSDMYSVGATLFYLLTGRTPFEGRNTVQLMATVFEKRAPSPDKIRPGIPRGLAAAVLRCLEKQPADRFKNYPDLARALAPYGSAAPTPATLWLRSLAGLLDQVLLGVISLCLLCMAGRNPLDFMNQPSQGMLGITALALACSILYYTLIEGRWGASVGKTICRLRIVGRDRNSPGFWRAFLRALIYVTAPVLPFWLVYTLCYGGDMKFYLAGQSVLQFGLSLSFYVVLGLFFCLARRRNGFASVYDLLTQTQVISRPARESRPELLTAEPPLREVASQRQVGPYHVLETIEQSGGVEWLQGYDLRLLRRVWIRQVPAGTPPVVAPLRNLGRPSRLRWLAGRRSPEENWDAFEAPAGRPLMQLAQTPQPWSQVRYWLYDLAQELSVAAKEGTVPATLALDRVWITGDGHAKLLDFPAPGLGRADTFVIVLPHTDSRFLAQVAAAAVSGNSADPASAGPAPVPLPLHARDFLARLPQLPEAAAIARALKPLLPRVAVVTRWRRAAIVAGCLAAPVFFGLCFIVGIAMFNQWQQKNPGLMEASQLLQQRNSMNSRWLKNQPHPTDRQFAIYLASHYRAVVTNNATWTSTYALTMVKGELRQFAERSVAENPAPTAEEIKDADAALKETITMAGAFDFSKQPWFPVMVAGAMLVIYVGFPALVAALIFRGGLVLLIARVTFVRRDGARASRLRLFWRALLVWSPLVGAFIFGSVLNAWLGATLAIVLPLLIIGVLTAVSVGLPERGLQDRLAGTWPVPR